MAEQGNKGLVRRWINAVNTRTWRDVGREIYADNVVFHDPGLPNGQASGLDSLGEYVSQFVNAIPDLHVNIDDMTEEGDRVSVRGSFTGTLKGKLPMLKIAPTGKSISIPAMTVVRVAGGKIVEQWHHPDHLSLQAASA